MRELANPRGGKKQFWVVLALSLVLTACVGTLLWLVWSEPDGLPASISEGQPSGPETSSSRSVSSSMVESSTTSESTASSGAPAARPVQHTGVGTGTGASAQKLQNLTINAALTHDENATYYNIYINSGGVTLKNKLVTGDLVLSESVGNGAVTLENVVVKGRILVNGAQTVTLRDVTAVELIAQRRSGTTDYTVGGASTIHQMTAKNHLTIDESGLSSNYAGVKKLTAERGTPMWQQVTLLKGALEQVTTNDATNLMLPNGGSVEAVIANAPTHIGGTGLVYNLTVCSDEVSYERKPRNMTVQGRYSEPNEQNWAIGESETAANGGSHSRTTSRTLATPQNLTMAAAAAENSVILAFDGVSNATGYTVIYSVINGSSALNITNQQRSVDTNSCTIQNALIGQEGTVVSFKVRAVSSASRYTASNYSDVCTRTVTMPGVPTNVQLTLNGNKLELSFTAAANAAACTHEAALSVKDENVAVLTLTPGVTTGEFTGLTAGETHTVTVRAVGDGRLTLTSGAATASYAVPSELPAGLVGRYAAPDNALQASNLAISSVGGKLAVTFTEAPGVHDYTVALRYNGAVLDALNPTRTVDENTYTYLFEWPDAIAAGGEYTASVTPQGGLAATESRPVQRREKPGNPRITSSALGEVTVEFDKEAGMAYQVVSATQTTSAGTNPLGVTATNLTATGLDTGEGDTFNFSVKTLGDGMFYADSQIASAEAAVNKLSEPISPAISGNQNNLTLGFITNNSLNMHTVEVQTSVDEGACWSTLLSKELAKGVTQAAIETPKIGALQIRFNVTAKAANALQADSIVVSSPVLSVVQLAPVAGLNVVDLDSGEKARFEFDAVADADSYTVSYKLSNGASGSIGPCTYATATSTPVTLDNGVTVTEFKVTAHAAPDDTHIYLDSTVDCPAP